MTPAFLLTSFVVVVTPGTGALFTVAAGLARGPRAGVLAALACTLGIVPHLLAAVTGLAALLHASGVAFAVVKYAGVAYLLWLAWTTWRSTGALRLEPSDADARPRPARQVIVAGITVNLLNPKLTVFFLAFLPQFVPSGTAHSLPLMLALGGVFMAMTFVVFAGYGVFAGAVRDRVLASRRAMTVLRRTVAVTFGALAGRLALQTR